ncbi:hypothetical protein EG832_01585 [bacterium]|nr:hypothetical protein [bacterium]
MTIYLVCLYIASLALGYVLAFADATLAIGKSLSDANTPTGYKDAITPPRFSTFAITVYVTCVGGLIFGFWRFGWLAGLGCANGFLFVVVLNKVLILPKSESEHFRNIIIRSMINRHANFLKSGDTLRASALSMLLEKLGMPVNDLNSRFDKNRNA